MRGRQLLIGCVVILLGVAVPASWPGGRSYLLILWGVIVAAGIVIALTSKQVLAFISRQLAPYVADEVVQRLPKPEVPKPAQPDEPPEHAEYREAVTALREMLGEAQEMRRKMAHAPDWLGEKTAIDRFGYFKWRASVGKRLIALRPEDADHFTRPPSALPIDDEADHRFIVLPRTPNQQMLANLDLDIDELDRKLHFYRVQLPA